MENRKLCFVMMPFQKDLDYFFLYLQHLVEKILPEFICIRADRPENKELFHKIYDYISKADLVIAVCTNNNPNVFFELGIAYEKYKNSNKIVYLIDEYIKANIPTDVIAQEFISYNDPKKFEEHLAIVLKNLDKNKRVDQLYKKGIQLIKEIRQTVKITAKNKSLGEAKKEIENLMEIGQLDEEDSYIFQSNLITCILSNSSDSAQIQDWLATR